MTTANPRMGRKPYTEFMTLPIIDELGFVPLSKTGAELLFELISQRYERGATLKRFAFNLNQIESKPRQARRWVCCVLLLIR